MSNEQSIRDEIAREIRAVTDGWAEPLDEVHDVPQIVNAILASTVIRRIQAETLREAARPFMDRLNGEGNGRAYNSYTVARLLKERADAIEQGETND